MIIKQMGVLGLAFILSTVAVGQDAGSQAAIQAARVLLAKIGESPGRLLVTEREIENLPTARVKFDVSFEHASVVITPTGQWTRISLPENEKQAFSGTGNTEIMASAQLAARRNEIIQLLFSDLAYFRQITDGTQSYSPNTFQYFAEERRGGFPRGQIFGFSFCARSGKLISAYRLLPYTYAPTTNLISKSQAIAAAKLFYNSRLVGEYGPWPGDSPVASATTEIRWQRPHEFHGSPGTAAAIAEKRWQLAHVVVVNLAEIHVNAHNGMIMGGAQVPRRKSPSPAQARPSQAAGPTEVSNHLDVNAPSSVQPGAEPRRNGPTVPAVTGAAILAGLATAWFLWWRRR